MKATTWKVHMQNRYCPVCNGKLYTQNTDTTTAYQYICEKCGYQGDTAILKYEEVQG